MQVVRRYHEVNVECEGYVPTKTSFLVPAPSAADDPGALTEMASVELVVQTFSLSGLVKSAQVGADPLPVVNARIIASRMSDLVQVGETVSGPTGVYTISDIPSGQLVVSSECKGLGMARKKVKLLKGDIEAGTIEKPGKADIIMHPPMDDKFRLEVVLKEYAKTLRQTFQHYCTAGAAGENDPFKLTLTQWFLFGSDMKLPEGPAPGGGPVSMAQAGNKIMAKFFQDSGDPSWSKRGIGFEDEDEGEEESLTGAMFVDDKISDDSRGYTEFLDMIVRLSWFCLTQVEKESVPLSRQGGASEVNSFVLTHGLKGVWFQRVNRNKIFGNWFH